jgi:hypothetical protein
MSADGEDEAASAVSLNESRFRLSALGIVRLAYQTALGLLRPLLGMASALLVPPIVLLLAALALLPHRDSAIINGTVVTSGGNLLDLVVLVPLGLLLVVAGLLAFAACSVMTAGALIGRPLGWQAALRIARSRLLPLAAVAGLLALIWLGLSAVLVPAIGLPLLVLPLLGAGGPDTVGPDGFVTGPGPGPLGGLFGGPFAEFAVSGFGLVASAAIALFALRFVVALPAAVLERLGTAGAALRYTVALTRGRVVATRFALAIGVVLVPELLARGGTGLAGVLAGSFGLGDSSRLLLHDVAAFGIRVGMVPFQVATLAVAFLNGRLPSQEGAQLPASGQPPAVEADLDRIATHLDPGPAPARVAAQAPVPWGPVAAPGGRRRRPVLVAVVALVVVAALAAPGLLTAASRALNPRGLAVVSDQMLAWRVRADAVEGTLTMSSGRPLAVVRAGGTLSLVACADRRCKGSDRVEVGSGFVSASAATLRGAGTSTPTPDGAAVAVWHQADDSHLELRLLTCTSGGCGALERAPLLDQAPADASERSLAAVAATPDGGLVVADLLAASKAASAGDDGRLRLLFCGDSRCADPRAVTVARGADLKLAPDPDETSFPQPPELSLAMTRPLAVTVSPDGRAAAALATGGDGPIVVATCDTPVCAHPAAARIQAGPGSGGAGTLAAYPQPRHGIDIALPAGRGALVTAEVPGNGETILLVCRTPACGSTNRITLAASDSGGPEDFPVGPAAVELDRQGRPVVAVAGERDLTPQGVLVACDDRGCQRRTTVALGEINSGAPVSPLDLALDADDRPAILWGGPDDGPGSLRLRLITCDGPRCRA